MLLKLLKYEIKSSYSKFIMAFLAYILIASVLMIFFRNHEIFNIYILTFGIITLCVITFLIIFNRYNSNLYNSEGYLMFTLPVDGKTLLVSKLISAFIWMFTLALIIIPSIATLVFYYSESGFINDTYKFFNMNKVYTVTFGIEYLLNIFCSVLIIYFSISISKLPIWKRFSALVGLGTYFVIALLSFMIKNVAKVVNTTAGSNVLLKDYSINILLFHCFIDLFIFVVLFFATSYLLNNRTSLK